MALQFGVNEVRTLVSFLQGAYDVIPLLNKLEMSGSLGSTITFAFWSLWARWWRFIILMVLFGFMLLRISFRISHDEP